MNNLIQPREENIKFRNIRKIYKINTVYKKNISNIEEKFEINPARVGYEKVSRMVRQSL